MGVREARHAGRRSDQYQRRIAEAGTSGAPRFPFRLDRTQTGDSETADAKPRPLFVRALSVSARTEGKPKWKLVKGILSAASKVNERGFVITKEKFRDFELTGEFELKVKGKYNSGISFV